MTNGNGFPGFTGKHHTERSRRKISQKMKGKSPWNKGLRGVYIRQPLSEESKKKISKSKQGQPSNFKGKHHGREAKRKIGEARKGHIPWNKGLKGYRAGEKSHLWKGGITPENKRERIRFRNETQKVVFKRDDYTCQICGKRGGYLQVDHIQSWAEYIKLRFNIDNCRTVCMKCHYKITFGKAMPADIKIWGHNFQNATEGKTL